MDGFRRSDLSCLTLAFCDVFEMRDGKIERLVSYLMEAGSESPT